jgi:RNA-directed DNA polymerase
VGASPSRKKVAKLCDAIREVLSRRNTWDDELSVVAKLNRKLIGWANDLSEGAVSRAYGVVNYHVTTRLRRWLCVKHKVRGLGYSRYPDRRLYQELGLNRLQRARVSVPKATV